MVKNKRGTSKRTDPGGSILKGFKKLNPKSSVEKKGPNLVINRPWNDESVSLVFNARNKDIPSALNKVILPEAFNAVYHTDTKELEVIFTIFPQDGKDELHSFEFDLEGLKYQCKFAEASKRLMLIASSFKRSGPASTTTYRGLTEFAYYFQASAKIQKKLTPTSFWISGVDPDITKLIILANHINFYARYFDTYCPTIILHEETTIEDEKKEVRFLFGTFPKKIIAHRINPYLLGLWSAAEDSSDFFLEYLYHYQIIEYAAYYYLSDDTAQKLNRILLTPHNSDFLAKSTTEIVDVISESKLTDSQKFDLIIKKYLDPEIVWNSIDPIKKNFVSETKFDGGFSIPALINTDTKLSDFKTMAIPKVAQQMREIRNAIAHSRDTKTLSVIEPTQANSLKIKAWTNLIRVVASQIMICRP